MTNTAIILGAGSAISVPLKARLAAEGWTVLGLGQTKPAGFADDDWTRFDPQEPGDWQAPSESLVFALLPIGLLTPLIPRLREARHLVAFSSTSVDAYAGSSDPDERNLSARLQEAEGEIRRSAEAIGLGFTIFRPTLIYGSGRDNNLTLIARWAGKWGFFPVAGRAGGRRQPVHIEDLAEACLAAVKHASAKNRTFVLAGGEALTYRQMVERVIAATHGKGFVLGIPSALLNLGFGLLNRARPGSPSGGTIKRMNVDQVFSIREAEIAFGYKPRDFHPSREDILR